jgi:predicted Zn-dependent protease
MALAIRLARQEFTRPSENESTRLSIREREEYSALVLADLLVENGRPAEAEAVLKKARGRLGASAPLEARQARLMGEMGDLVAATELLDEAILREPDNADLHSALGDVLKGRNNERAVQAAERACHLDPTRGVHHTALADLLVALGRQDEAEQVLVRAMSVIPDHPDLKISLARLLERRGATLAAISLVREVIASGLSDAWLSSHLGGLLLEVGSLDEASEVLDQSAQMDPDDVLTQFRLGRLHEIRGDLSAAIPFFRAAAGGKGAQSWMWSHLGAVLLKTSNLDEARDALQRAMDLDPHSWLNHMRLGRLLELQGELEASVRVVRAAIDMKPDEAWMWSHLGQLLMQQQLWADAERAIGQALSIDPDDQVTKERLRQLRDAQTPGQDDCQKLDDA